MIEAVTVLPDLSATQAVGRAIGQVLRVGDVVTLSGPLGAGKTTLARAMIEALGWDGDVGSPSFPIVLTYDAPDVRVAVAHVDLYRIEDRDQLEELGLDELRETAALIVEWPEHGDPFADALALTLAVSSPSRFPEPVEGEPCLSASSMSEGRAGLRQAQANGIEDQPDGARWLTARASPRWEARWPPR